MSNIRIDNIAPSAGGTYRNAPRGIAAAWVNFNGTGTVAIRDSENVGSITDNGTGDYTVNFTSAMADANYCLTGMAGNAINGLINISQPINTVVPTTSSVLVNITYTNGTSFDAPACHVAIHGDLA